MDGWKRFSETKLQHKRMFYSSLSDEHIMQKKVLKVFECKHFGDYHDLYLKTGDCFLADVLENFRSIFLEQCGMDPDHY